MGDIPYFDSQVKQLQSILNAHQDKRVCIVGTTCTGKSYLVEHLHGAQDMDDLIFPLLSKEEKDYVCQKPWTPEIGDYMERLARERERIFPGKPVFGTVVFESDFLIHLRITDYLLQQRVAARGKNYADAIHMRDWIEACVKKPGIQRIEFLVG